MATAREDWMTDTDPPNQEGTDEAAETPTYKSPLELILEKMPIFGSMFSDSGKSGGGGGSGRFEFSLEEMRELHRQFEYEVSALEDMAKTSQRSTHMLQPLAPDDASLKHYKRSQEHFFKLAKAVQQQLEFATGFRDAIAKAIGVRSDTEDSIGSQFRVQGEKVV